MNLAEAAVYSMEQSSGDAFLISRILSGPREVVWSAWTEKERLRWWGPRGATVTVLSFEMRPDGMFHYHMRTPDGGEMWGRWIIRNIIKPERLVFISSFSDQDGNLARHPWHATWPLEMLSTITFSSLGDRTLLTVQWLPLNPTDAEQKAFEEGQESMRQGWTGTLDRLVEYLERSAGAIQPD